jgi:FkbM family methyltransferase
MSNTVWPPHGSTPFGKYCFFDCGSFGLFTLAEERFQPVYYGKKAYSPEKFYRERTSRKVDLKNIRLWTELGDALKFLGNGTTVLDVGGYIGTFCIPLAIAAKEAGLDLQFHTFEPGPTYELLNINLQANQLTQTITLHHAAMSNYDGHTIYRFATGGSIGGAVFGDPKETDQERVAPCYTVDRFCQSIPGKLLIKLDTQGHEPDIMMHARDVIASKRAVWQIEFMAWSGRKDIGGKSFADYLLSQFYCLEGRKEITKDEMPAFLNEVDARKSRMADLLLIPKDAQYEGLYRPLTKPKSLFGF